MTANLKTIAWRVLGAFVLAFLAALPAGFVGFDESVLKKAAFAGLFAAAALVQSVLTNIFTGQPQITATGRSGASASRA